MTHDAQTPKIAQIAPLAIANLLARSGRKTLASARTTLKTLQTARMISVLTKMSDFQLSQIGITRSEIPEYANELMKQE